MALPYRGDFTIRTIVYPDICPTQAFVLPRQITFVLPRQITLVLTRTCRLWQVSHGKMTTRHVSVNQYKQSLDLRGIHFIANQEMQEHYSIISILEKPKNPDPPLISKKSIFWFVASFENFPQFQILFSFWGAATLILYCPPPPPPSRTYLEPT